MTEALIGLVAGHGTWLLAAITFLSCLALPVPASLAMMAAGAFVAVGDLSGTEVIAAALVGAVAGDQAGYALGRRAKAWLARLALRGGLGVRIGTARSYLAARGGRAVFLSRWLVSPLGPYVNLAAGAAGLDWRRFSMASLAGECLWVGLYVGLGWAFGTQIDLVADLAGWALTAVAASAAAVFSGRALWRRHRRKTGRPSGLLRRRGRQM